MATELNKASRGAKPAFYAALLAAVLLLIRLPLWLLPGPGRDEAAYYYWAHHPEPAYSLLVQAAIRLGGLVAGHSLWALRLPVLVLGLLVLVLNDRRLARAGSPVGWRGLAAAALALNPWQSFAGSILHPDNFMLAALLLLVLAIQERRLWLATLATVGAVLAKPTGVLFLPVTWWLLGTLPGPDRRQLHAARLVLVLAAVGLAVTMRPDMVVGMAGFGRMSDSLPWLTRLIAGGGSTLFLGGPVLLGLAVLGVRQRWPDIRTDDEARASLSLAAILLVVFLTAALLRGQFKGNWILPAAVLLWPLRPPRRQLLGNPRRLVAVGLVLALLTSLGQTLAMSRPDLIDNWEHALSDRNLVPAWLAYETQAGTRETAVSSSRTWSDHLHEYDDISGFAAQLKSDWCCTAGEAAPLPWIIAGDYGLACQLHWYLAEPQAAIAIYGDGIFCGTWSEICNCAPPTSMLALSLPPDGQVRSIAALPVRAHPITGFPLRPAVVRWSTH